jgi:PASTA domain/NPCBM/NEW2 domain
VEVAELSRVPDVRGMRLADAKQAFADTGVDPAAVAVVEVAAALEPGTVVAQSPVGGEAATGKAELKVAKPAVVPAIAGRTEQDVVNELTALGARVHVGQRYVPTAKPGEVLETAPAPGKPVVQEVTVIVAAQPSSVYLDQISLLSGGCGTGRVKINGRAFEHGRTCSVGSDTAIELLLDRGVGKITGVAGVPDTGDPADAVRLVISGDGKELYRRDLRYGAGEPVDIITAGVLRLTMTVTGLAQDRSASLALGDVVLFGAPDTIAQLDR